MPRVPNLSLLSFSLFSLLVVWTQPALIAGNRIRFGRQVYTFTEGQSSKCLDVVKVGSPGTSSFSVTYTIDAVLLGGQRGVRIGSLNFPAGNLSGRLCLDMYPDDEIVCEKDVVGVIHLINTSTLQVDEPSTATVRIKDDDTIALSFPMDSMTYTEGSGMHNIAVTLDTSVEWPITIQVTGVAAGDTNVIRSNSGVPLSFMLTFEPTIQQKTFSLDITDDDIALEDPEEIILSLSVSSSECKIIPSIDQMQVTILDNDEVVIELKEERISVAEYEGEIQVCVVISSEIARPLSFSITTQDESATGGLDYTSEVFTAGFAPFSQERELCFPIPILEDRVVEDSETFSVSLAVDSLQNEHLKVTNAVTQVSIQDSSYCFSIKLTPLDVNEPQFIPPLISVCFTCTCETETSVSWSMQGRPIGPKHGLVLSNGTLLIPNSSQEFSSNVPTVISCMVQENYSFEIFLGEPASVLNLISAQEPNGDGLHLILTCSYEGTPVPSVQWSFDGASLELPNPDLDIKTTNVRSVLTVLNATESSHGIYTCNVENEFGSSNNTIMVDMPSVTVAGVGNGARRSRSWTDTLTVLLFGITILLCY